MRSFTRTAAALAVVLAGGTTLAACGANSAQSGGSDSSSSGSTGSGSGTKTVALLLPESKTTRYEAFDKPLFQAALKKACSDCKFLYYNADQDEAKQNQQVTTAVSQGANVIVLDPVNGAGAGGMVSTAQSSGAKVIAYDRFIAGVDYYMSFDNETVGKMQATALTKDMGGKGSILMLNGAPNDPNAAQFKKGAHDIFDANSGVKILAEYDNPDWSPENAQQWTTDQLAKYPTSTINGVYAANDGQAGGVVAALTGAGKLAPTALPPITGQDAELAAIQRILTGEQAMTIYKPIPVEADTAAEVAADLANGTAVATTSDTGIKQSTYQSVKSYIFTPIAVTKSNVEATVVKDGFYKASDICTSDYASACSAAGVK